MILAAGVWCDDQREKRLFIWKTTTAAPEEVCVDAAVMSELQGVGTDTETWCWTSPGVKGLDTYIENIWH